MQRKPCKKGEDEKVSMTKSNVMICVSNQDGAYQTPELNQSLHLQYYGFANIDNLAPFSKVHTLFLNNNVIERMENLESLTQLVTLNLSYNCITKICNLKTLHNLYTLDLSGNRVTEVPAQEVSGLKSLSHFKLAKNRLSSYESISGIATLA